MCDYLQTRANAGKQTAMAHKGKQVDLKKLRRVMKEYNRQQITMRPVTSSLEAGASLSSHIVVPFGNTVYEFNYEIYLHS
jgi:hypothetical protein